MSLDVLGYVIAGLFAFAAAVYTTWATRKAKETQDAVEKVRVDGEAYDRAQKINTGIVAELQREVARQVKSLADVRLELQTERAHSAELEMRMETLHLSVDRLTRLLDQHGIPIPTWGAG